MTRRPVRIGLTGSISMGKSETARMFARLGAPLFDADAEVHKALAPGGAGFAAVAEAFPDAARGGVIDRRALGRAVFKNDVALRRLESLLHPLVGEARARFLRAARALGACVVVLDIPLLFETGGERHCDIVVVVSAPLRTQRRRALARPGMTKAAFEAVLKRQTPDAEKRRRADFVVPTGLGRRAALRAVRRVLRIAASQRSRTCARS